MTGARLYKRAIPLLADLTLTRYFRVSFHAGGDLPSDLVQQICNNNPECYREINFSLNFRLTAIVSLRVFPFERFTNVKFPFQ